MASMASMASFSIGFVVVVVVDDVIVIVVLSATAEINGSFISLDSSFWSSKER